MGKTPMGSSQHKGNIDMLTKEQKDLFSQILGGDVGQDFITTLGQTLQPQGGEGSQAMFQQTYVDPSLKALDQQIIPGIQQRFADANASSSSALNQALSQAATDVTTNMGSQYGNFLQNQQNMGLQGMLSLLTNKTFTPMIQQQQGLAGPLIGAAGQIGAAAMMPQNILSSRDVKENIKDYKSCIEDLKQLNVKQYDYVKEVGGQKDNVGLIAEDLPKELTLMKDGMLHVDLYGLMGLMINSMKSINERLQAIEEVV